MAKTVVVLPEETTTPREVPQNDTTSDNNNKNNNSSGGGSRASVLIAASAAYSPNAIAIYSSNPADPNYYSANGQGFTASVSAYVTSAMFRMISQTNVSLTAAFEARIYAASGASPNLPTGSPLAISAPVTWNEILAMTNSGNLEIPFTFDGTFQVQQGTNYYVCVVATSGALSSTNYMWTYYSAVNTALNSVRFRNNAWTNNSNNNLYFSVIGSTTSGGGDGNFDGGTINNPLEIKCQFPYLADQPAVNSWMTSAPLNPSNYNAYLRFTNINSPQHSTDIYGISFKDDTNTTVPAIGINDSLLVRKNLFTQGYMRTAKSILRLEKSSPYVPPNAGASGNVNLGTATWPFDEIFASYGHIGDLEVPSELKVDYIKSLSNTDLTIKSWAGKKVKLDGDVQITGTLTGGAAAPDWYNVPFIHLKGNMYLDAVATAPSDPMQFIEILSKPWEFTDWDDDIIPFMRQYHGSSLDFDNPKSAAIKFKSTTLDGQNVILTASLFQVNFNMPQGTGPNPGIVCSHHFVIRKDLFINGMINCIEGAIVLHAGPYRQWNNIQQNPTIYTSETDHHEIDFLKFGSTTDFVPIRVGKVYTGELEKLSGKSGIKIASALLDDNGNPGNSGEVLTSTGAGSAPIWHPVGGGSGGVQKGSVTTDGNGDATVGFSAGTFPSGYTPTIVCTAYDISGRSITAVVTSSSNAGFTVKTFLVSSHQHKIGQVYNTTTNPITISKSGKHHHYAVGTTGTTSHRHGIPTQANHNHYAVGTSGTTTHRHGIPNQAVHNHYAVGTTGVTSHRHGIPNQGDHSHGITNGNVGNYNTSTVTAGGTPHAHTYSSWVAAASTNNGGSHNHGGNTDNETSHAHTYSTTTSDSGSHNHGGNTDNETSHAHTYSTTTSDSGSHNHDGYTDNETSHAHTFATTTSGSGTTPQDADAEHTHNFSQIPDYMRETVMYTQGGSPHSIGATMTTQQQTAPVTELYTINTVNTPIAILVNWIAI
ncbi:MAG: hypothetical protein FWH37_08775 [Candidatus Bathyarchaeota archaeon]|nr:hypothetical protein [Candidatus Termiticorpusculum sp.]